MPKSRARRQANDRRRCTRLYMASTATTALTCHYIDIVIICKCTSRTFNAPGTRQRRALFRLVEVFGKGIIVICQYIVIYQDRQMTRVFRSLLPVFSFSSSKEKFCAAISFSCNVTRTPLILRKLVVVKILYSLYQLPRSWNNQSLLTENLRKRSFF